jgi:MFS family permease
MHPEYGDDRSGGFSRPLVLRIVQGVSAGGEQAGSALLALEHAPDDRRGFYASWTQGGSQLGNFLAFAVFVPLAAALPEAAMSSWGWRVPFWASAVVVLVTFFLRRRLSEPVVRQQLEREGLARRVPLLAVLLDHRAEVIRIVLASVCIAPAGLVYIFGLSYGTTVVGLDKTGLLDLVSVTSLLMVVAQPLFGMLSDQIGRKPVFLVGVGGTALTVPLYLNALHNGNWLQIYVFGLLLLGVFVSMTAGIVLATFLEMFPADIRFSGMAVSFTTGIVVTGFIPAITQSMIQGNPGNLAPIAWFFVGIMIVSGVAIASAPETAHVPTGELGMTRRRADPAPPRGRRARSRQAS